MICWHAMHRCVCCWYMINDQWCKMNEWTTYHEVHTCIHDHQSSINQHTSWSYNTYITYIQHTYIQHTSWKHFNTYQWIDRYDVCQWYMHAMIEQRIIMLTCNYWHTSLINQQTCIHDWTHALWSINDTYRWWIMISDLPERMWPSGACDPTARLPITATLSSIKRTCFGRFLGDLGYNRPKQLFLLCTRWSGRSI